MISVVLPVHDQASHIGAVVTEYCAAVDRLNHPYELILIPNGCRDDSEQVCRTLAAERVNVRMVALSNRGWGFAVRAGLAATRGDVLCYTNSARTTGEMLFLFLAYGLAYRGVVIKANRRIRDGLVRRAGSLLYNLECRALFDLACWDINGTPKVFPAGLRPLVELTRDDDLIDLEFVVACRRHDYRLLEVPVLSTRRRGGTSTTNIRSALAMYAGAIQMWRRQERAS